MSGRIYSQEVFEKALREIEKGEKYCPNCLSNDIDYKERDNNIVYIHEYKCYSFLIINVITLAANPK